MSARPVIIAVLLPTVAGPPHPKTGDQILRVAEGFTMRSEKDHDETFALEMFPVTMMSALHQTDRHATTMWGLHFEVGMFPL
jgi:hypothetical protein